MLIYKSESLDRPANGGKKVLPLDFLQEVGPTRGRVAVKAILMKIDIQVDTPVGSTANGARLATAIKRLRLFDGEADRVNLTGEEIRLLDQLERGRDAIPDVADIIANTNNQPRTIWLRLDLAPVRARRRWDFAMPSDNLLKGGGIEVEFPSAADLGFTGGDPTSIDSLTVVFYFFCREERDIESHARRELRSVTAVSRTDLYAPVNGALVRSLILWKAADNDFGGTDISSIATVTADAMGLSAIDATAFRYHEMYEGNHDGASTADPFAPSTHRALCIEAPDRDQKIPSMFSKKGSMLIRLTGSTVDNVTMVMDLVTGRTKRSQAGEIALTRRASRVSVVMKTAGKTAKDPKRWGKFTRYMPAKVRITAR